MMCISKKVLLGKWVKLGIYPLLAKYMGHQFISTENKYSCIARN